MKTTLEVADALLEAAKDLAARENTTLRAVIEKGLRMVLADKPAGKPFRLRDKSFQGRGLHPDFAGRDWSEIRNAAYEGRS